MAMVKFIAVFTACFLAAGLAFGKPQILIEEEIPGGFWPAVWTPKDSPALRICEQGECIYLPVCFSSRGPSESAPFEIMGIKILYRGNEDLRTFSVLYPSGRIKEAFVSKNGNFFNVQFNESTSLPNESVVQIFLIIPFARNANTGIIHEFQIEGAEFRAVAGNKIFSDNQNKKIFRVEITRRTQTSVSEEIPAEFSSLANYPNPFNPSTTIDFTLAKAGNIAIEIYNISGQKIVTLAEGFKSAGRHSIVWNARSLSAGNYFCILRQEGKILQTKKMTLLK